MKKTSYLFIILLPFVFLTCTSKQIKISQDFDHGSIGELEEVKPGYFRGSTKHWTKKDNIGDQYYWFYFKAENIKGKTVTFELNDLIGVYRGNKQRVYTDYTQPVYSYDQKNWSRITDVKYDSTQHTFTFRETFDQESAWIAYAHPYSYSRYKELISGLEGEDYVTSERISVSPEGREIKMLTITDQNIPVEDKKTIFIMALQHSGEDAGGFLVEGMIEYLLSENNGAAEARKDFVYKIIPMMNPDGIYNGITRYNSNRADLNSIWLKEDIKQPEVSQVKDWVNEWYNSGNQIDLFIDVHNHTQYYKLNALIYEKNPELDSLVQCMRTQWPLDVGHNGSEGSARSWLSQKGVLSGTFELSQSRNFSEKYLTIEDYKKYGKGTVKAISSYFK